MDESSKYPFVSIIVFGLNEEKNLHDTFDAIMNIDYPKEKYELIYVDNGSKDESVAIAKNYTESVFIEDKGNPSPAQARNRGLLEANFDIIHFIDGDIVIDKNYLKKAVKKLEEMDIHAVYGYLDEKSKKGVNNILLTHWKDKKEGFSNAVGGGGTFRRNALLSIDGNDERIRRGAETELGERFRKAGFKIWYMNCKMGIHDYGVKNVWDLVKTYYIDGQSKSHIMMLSGKSDFIKTSNRTAINNILFCMFFLGLFIISAFFVGYYSLLVFFIVFYGYFFINYIMIKKIFSFKKLSYFFLMHNFKYITFWGQLVFFIKIIFNPSYRKLKILPKSKLS
ncbi:glycosyltransferase [Desulfotignum phosphitoxidans]|uniref:Glycosyl transferase family 2 n=1 Tax=Desulfotignum phosphitoxidans DSM 13687 TaxID=1286635 RepID=S0G1T4_9BACT|nr:glycosyltransferase [Desulfotignum phosphitoxidans]EMS77661.1 glycosyl transferase family 2 [Desulfotignum phosphitoxidans DSM 13687]